MEELERMAEAVRKHDAAHDYEEAHAAEDSLLARALEIIAEGTDNPATVARLGLSTQSDDTVRWFA
jgi:hypothetical protein